MQGQRVIALPPIVTDPLMPVDDQGVNVELTKPCGDRETFERGRPDGDGVAGLKVQDSATQKALAGADLLIRRRPGAPGLPPGDMVPVLDF